MNVRVVHGALEDGEQFGAADFEIANAVQRHLARVAVALGGEFEQARTNLRQIFAPELDHQVGRRPSDIAVVVGHRLAQRVGGIHRERARADLSRARTRQPIARDDRRSRSTRASFSVTIGLPDAAIATSSSIARR